MIISLLLNIHLFLIITEFEVRNVSYGSSLFMAQTRRARTGKTRLVKCLYENMRIIGRAGKENV